MKQEFIDTRTEGYEDFKKELLSTDIAEMEKVTGVDRELVRKAAIAYASSPAAMSFHGLGVTEHYQGTFTVMQIADIAMMTGNIGRRGVGVNPLRGQNNVQGAADMGCQPHQGAGYFAVDDPNYSKLYDEFYGVHVPDVVGKWHIPTCRGRSRRCMMPCSRAHSKRCGCAARTWARPTRTRTTCARPSARSTSSWCRSSS